MADLEPRYYDPITRIFAIISTVVLIAILAWVLVGSARNPSMQERLDFIEAQNEFIVCLLLIEPAERTPEAVAGCQTIDPLENP